MAESQDDRPGLTFAPPGRRLGPIVFVSSADISDEPPEEIFDHGVTAFEDAARESVVERSYSIADCTVRLRIAGRELDRRLTPALAHLAVDDVRPPSLTILGLDARATGAPRPLIPAACRDDVDRLKADTHGNERIPLWYQPAEVMLSALDRHRDLGLLWVGAAEELPYYESGAPFIHILHWWMAAHGRQLLHGGAVGRADGGVLLVGRGGSGKSTAALSCLDSELSYVSDDYVLVAIEPEPYVYSIYNTGKLDSEHERSRPGLLPPTMNPVRPVPDKALAFVHEHRPDKILSGCPIRAIVLPRVSGRHDSRFRRVPRAAALSAAAPSTIFQLAGAGRSAFVMMSELVRSVPTFALETGADLASIPPVIEEILELASEGSGG